MNVGISLLLLVCGFIFGSVFSLRPFVQKSIPSILHYIVYVLLFFLAVELGSTPNFMQKLTELGKNAFLISLACIIGACVASMLVKYIFFKNTQVNQADIDSSK